MKDKLFDICKYILMGLMGLIVLFVILTLVKGQDGTDMEMKFTYVFIIIAALAMILSPIYGMIIDPKSIKGVLIAIGLAVVVALLALLLSRGSKTAIGFISPVREVFQSMSISVVSACSSAHLKAMESLGNLAVSPKVREYAISS